jgi:hypothetical protein
MRVQKKRDGVNSQNLLERKAIIMVTSYENFRNLLTTRWVKRDLIVEGAIFPKPGPEMPWISSG